MRWMPWRRGRRRTWAAAKSRGAASRRDPGISEWGNPPPGDGVAPRAESIGTAEGTAGTETSQYREEETCIPLVVASERGGAQTDVTAVVCRRCCGGVVATSAGARAGTPPSYKPAG